MNRLELLRNQLNECIAKSTNIRDSLHSDDIIKLSTELGVEVVKYYEDLQEYDDRTAENED